MERAKKRQSHRKKPLPPGAGGNPTTASLDENDEKIHMLVFKRCRETRERRSRKTEAKVRFEEPGASATTAPQAAPPTETPAGVDRDEHGELLDYEDDIGEPPFDPMNDELPSIRASWDSELDGPSMDITPSQESALLANNSPRKPETAAKETRNGRC